MRTTTIIATIALTCAIAVVTTCQPSGIGPMDNGPALDSLHVSATSMLADDVSLVTLTDTIPANTGIAAQTITFASTAGVFAADSTRAVTVATNGAGSASTQLRAQRTATSVTVSAGVSGALRYASLAFAPALPDEVEVEATPFLVSTDSGRASPNVVIRVLLLRHMGLVTPGTVVALTDHASDSTSIGRFGIIPPSDDSGLVRVNYSPGNGTRSPVDTLKGPITDTIYASVAVPGQDSARGKTIITVTP